MDRFLNGKPGRPCCKKCFLFIIVIGLVYKINPIESAAHINSFGGYENLVISIGNDVPSAVCQQLLGNIQKIFTSSSTYLNQATHGKIYFHRITIVVPAHWDTCEKMSSYTSAASSESADFHIVGNTHPVFGNFPFTQQSQGCGKPGDFISMGHQYLLQYNETRSSASSTTSSTHYNYRPTQIVSSSSSSSRTNDNNGDLKAKVLQADREIIHEWVKFRYGVFEEKGYPNDPIYPVSYHLESGNGEKLPTSCSNKPLKGSWSRACTDPTDSTECIFIPSQDNDNVTSSIMSIHVPLVRDFCDSTTHNPAAPTKHNFMCRQQSIEDVIFSHPDFYNITTRFGGGTGFGTPEFVIKQLTQPRYVLLIEETGNMNLRDVWKYLKLAVRKFIKYDLTSATQIGLITVGADVRVIANMTTLDENLRATLAEKLPTYPNIDSNSVGGGLSLRRGIGQAINMLKLNGQRVPGSVIILISQGTISTTDSEISLHLLKQEEVSIATIEYPSAGDGKISFLSHGTNSPHFTIRESGVGPMSHMSTYIQLVNAMMDIQRYFSKGVGLKWPILVHQEEFKGDAPSFVESSFSYDSSQAPGEFHIYVPNPIDPKINQVELTSPSGTKYTDKVSKLHDINVIKIDATIDQPGIWRYRIQRLGDSHQSHFVQIVTFGSGFGSGSIHAHQQQQLLVKVFSNVEESRIVNLDAMPLILYADVKRENSPVIGADVVAVVNGKWKVRLLDNGNGDPDITKGDGIYSKYIIPPTSSHILDITVKVTTSPYHSTYYSSNHRVNGPSDLQQPTCCGSSLVQTPTETTFRAMPYNERIIYSYSVKLLNAKDPGSTPLARIGDFRLVNSYDLRATFEFTSPVDDYDSELVSQYQVYWNERSRQGKGYGLKETLTFQLGVGVNFTLNFPAHRIYFLAVVVIDGDGRKSEFSNIVEVELVPPPQVYGSHSLGLGNSYKNNLDNAGSGRFPPMGYNKENSLNSSTKLSSSEILFIVTGLISFILVTLLILICVYCRRRNSKGLGSTETHISTISDCTKVVPPAHWSASELLHQHEKRGSIYETQQPHYTTYYEKTLQQQLHGHQQLLEDNVSPDSCSSHSISESTTILKTSVDSVDESLAGGRRPSGPRLTAEDYDSCTESGHFKTIIDGYSLPPSRAQHSYHHNINDMNNYNFPHQQQQQPQRAIHQNHSYLIQNNSISAAGTTMNHGSLTSINSKQRNITMV